MPAFKPGEKVSLANA
ncbi:Uncharacterized protein GY17_00003990, partial [Cryptosporidium hominis]